MKPQRRGRRIALDRAELDALLVSERTARVASVGRDGRPHVAPLWFVWDGSDVWFYSIVTSQRWADLIRDPRVAVVVDAGAEFFELHGAELQGTVQVVGEVPQRTTAEVSRGAEALFEKKYGAFIVDGRHAWLRLTPDKIVSWDHRKIPPPS